MTLPATLHTFSSTAIVVAEGFGVHTDHDAHLRPKGEDNIIHATKFPVNTLRPHHINKYHQLEEEYETTPDCTLDFYAHKTAGELHQYIPTTIDPLRWADELAVYDTNARDFYTVHHDQYEQDMCNLISLNRTGRDRPVKKEPPETITDKLDSGEYLALMPFESNPSKQ